MNRTKARIRLGKRIGKRMLKELTLTALGSAILSLGFTYFIQANGLLSGGFYAITGLVYHFFAAIPFSILLLILSIPVFIWAWFELNRKFVVYTGISIFLQSMFLAIFANLPHHIDDPLLAAIFGGAMVGLGGGIAIKGKGAAGGLDLISLIIRKKTGLSVGNVSMGINLFLMLLATLVFDLKVALYSIIIIVVAGKMTNLVLEGLSRKRTAMIITDRGEEMGLALMQSLNRGVTVVPCYGAYTGREREILYTVVNMLEIARVKEIVRDVDPKAFLTISETSEVRGQFNKHHMLFDRSDESL